MNQPEPANNDRSEKSTSDVIANAEQLVGVAITQELADHLKLAQDLTDLAGSIIENIQNAKGEPRAVHVATILLARLITDLQACSHLLRKGYAAQALSLTAGMLEIAHMSMFIGSDDERATKWLSHSDPKRASPWTVKETVYAVADALGTTPEVAEREYDSIYRQANMAKHGNPMALGEVGVHSEDESIFVLAGPYLSTSVRRFAHAAILYGIRYTLLPAMKYARDHLPDSPQTDGAFDSFRRLAAEHGRLLRADIVLFARDTGASPPAESNPGHP